ncbi:hypothetical protein FGE12_06475 [Aggregicoccus sp. 17bor-14]|uniref:hypothetical protein n=1 Tax=Myxococcaceae TaxID=31 RepID=UPI00129CEC53|nr:MULTISPECIES: hypothetical protein [Myxococcaceae]MBF5042033.1 hypothetical protein [Simulacricoccus sp. 17bor-14]MRI87812.1 hypothetical protein [Aggregicoccus sp. 17bor-14]
MTCAERGPRSVGPRALGLLLLLLLLAACAGQGGGDAPAPASVHPARGVSLQATPVVIEGARFEPLAVRHLSGSEAVEVDARFAAALGAVALEQVVWRDAAHLEAVVPAGLAPGLYRLTVTGPRGAQGSLEAAFQVVDQPFARLTAQAELPRSAIAPGEALALGATLENAGDGALTGLSATLVQEGTGAVDVEAAASGEEVLAAGGSVQRAWTVRGRSPGEVRLFVEARGVDAESGLEVTARTALAPLRVLGPAVLQASLSLTPQTVNIGSNVAVALTVRNVGELGALDVQPQPLAVEGSAALVRVSGPDAAGFTLGAGEARTVQYVLRALSAGQAQVRASVSAREAFSGAALVAEPAAVPLTELVPATLQGALVLPAQVSVGQDFEVSLDVRNTGESAAEGLQPSVVPTSGAVTLTATPAAQDVPGGQLRRFTFGVHANAAGRPTLSATGSAVDATSGAPVSLSTGPSPELPVQSPPVLTATLTAPASVELRDAFDVVLTVRNTGQADAADVVPTALAPSAPALVTQLSAPPATGVAVAAGSSATFTWRLRAQQVGSLSFAASAGGRDTNSGAAVSAAQATSAPTRVSLVRELAADPFADGTSFSFLATYGGRLLLGPSKNGTGAVAMNADGTGAQSLAFSLPRDPGTGKATSNKAAAPYPSIGATGCAKDTLACGPDNEDGRGVFFSGVGGGSEFLGVAGGRSAGDWNYVYLTRDSSGPLRFSFVDLKDAPPGPATRGVSSARFVNGALYLGLPDDGGNRPYFIRLRTFPSGQGGGLDAVGGTDALNLDLDDVPTMGVNGSPKNAASTIGVDALGDFGGLLYLANNGGWLRATVAEPRSYVASPADWKLVTPTAAAYGAHVSQELPRSADLEPADKAVPFFAVLQGRLYAARNTLSGPQLWVCNPATVAPLADCDAGDWQLFAPNTTGTLTLSQFNTAANAQVTLLAASTTRLYVGFNNAGGAVVYRSKDAAPASAADFEGQGGCAAAQGAGSCPGLGGNGLGAGAQRLYDSAVLRSSGRDFVYVTAGSPGAPVRVFRIVE